MLNIGICDDNQQDINLIADEITKSLFADEDIRIFRYSSGEKLLADIKEDKFCCNLLYLDIYMEPIDGMAVADYIRNNKLDVDIIFVTNSTEHVYKGYLYKAFSYILKNNLMEDVGIETKRYLQEIQDSEECINVTSDNVARKLPISQIIYVESSGRKLTLHMTNEDVSFYAKMADIEPVLTERGFIRTHQSYMIRIKKITGMTKETVSMGDIDIPISRRYYNEVRDTFNKTSVERGEK